MKGTRAAGRISRNRIGGKYPGVRFDSSDEFEPTSGLLTIGHQGLGAGGAIGLRYAHADRPGVQAVRPHSSVIGFGVDDEWYLNKHYRIGKPITDAEAHAVGQSGKEIQPNYKLFLKHWLSNPDAAQLPQRAGIRRRQPGFPIDWEDMMSEFTAWGAVFSPAPVGFQFGYEETCHGGARSQIRPKTIGNGILARKSTNRIPGTCYWVDFTAQDIWP